MDLETRQEFEELLSHTSRSFSIGIMGLDEPLHDEVCLGYLLCRIFDTYEDTLRVSAPLRRDCLIYSADLLASLDRPERTVELLEAWTARHQFPNPWAALTEADEWEYRLLEQGHRVWREVAKLNQASRLAFKRCLTDMLGGMESEVVQRQIAGDTSPRTLSGTDAYCYAVAGTVGCLLTELFKQQGAFGEARVDAEIEREGIEFGKALQLVNILKDFHKDWLEGRCYWPELALPSGPQAKAPLGAPLEEIFCALKKQFQVYLHSAEAYIARLESSRRDLHFFCAFPLKMAVATLEKASLDMTWLATGGTFKVSHLEVANILDALTKGL